MPLRISCISCSRGRPPGLAGGTNGSRICSSPLVKSLGYGFLFITQAGKAYENAFFRAKLILLLLLGINAAVYQTMFYPKMAQWDLAGRTPAGARFCAGLSLIVWIGVIVCGRTMAYQF